MNVVCTSMYVHAFVVPYCCFVEQNRWKKSIQIITLTLTKASQLRIAVVIVVCVVCMYMVEQNAMQLEFGKTYIALRDRNYKKSKANSKTKIQ